MNLVTFNYEDFCNRANKLGYMKVLNVRNTLSTAGVWLGGGAIRRSLLDMPQDSDYDFFFKDENSFLVWQNSMPPTMKITKETAHHIQYEGVLFEDADPVVIQGIYFKFYQTPKDVIDSFDFTITQFVLDGDTLITTAEALWDTANKRLAINKITYPVATMRRLLKYTKQGFYACNGCLQDVIKKSVENPEAMEQLDIEYVD